MKRLLAFTQRNLMVYLKNKSSIFFSVLTSVIVLGLYLLFLRDNYTQPLIEVADQMSLGLSAKDISLLSDEVIIAATISLSTITIPVTVLQNVVNDKEKRIDYDILSSPLKRWEIILGYFLSAVIASFALSSLLTTIAWIYLYFQADTAVNTRNMLQIYSLNLLSSLSSSALYMIVVSFIQRQASFSSFYGLFSAMIGFIVGAYVPISQFPEMVQNIFLFVPQTLLTCLYRRLYTENLLDHLYQTTNHSAAAGFLNEMKRIFSIDVTFFGHDLTNEMILVYVLVLMLLSLSIAIFIYAKRYKK